MNKAQFIKGMKSDICFSDEERRRIIKNSVKRDPWKLKCMITVEELSELQQQISKQVRGFDDKNGLLEEMADVYICLSFIESIFNISSEEISKAIDVKLNREKQRINNRRN